jgi:site-specific recombinase XerD
MRRKLVGWRFIQDTEEHLYPKMRKALDVLKRENRVLSSKQLAVLMGYTHGRAAKKAVEITAYRLKKRGLIEPVIELVEGPVRREMRELVESSEAVKCWMRRLRSEETKDKFLFLFLRYFQWIESKGFFGSPDAMLEHKQLAMNDKDRYYHISLVEDYLAEADLPSMQEKSVYTAVRSFYKHNKAALPSYPLKFKDKTLRVSVPQQPITLDELREMLSNARPREKAMFLCMLQAGMDRSTLCECFNIEVWPQLVKQLGSENPEFWDVSRAPVQVSLVRPKTKMGYYSFLSVDALKALQAWLKVRQTMMDAPLKSGEPLFITSQRKPMLKDNVSGIFKRLAISSGLETRKYGKPNEVRYRFHSHELRDTLRTACTVAGVAHPVAEYIIGHDIDKLHYDKSPEVYPEHYKQEYTKVEQLINIFSSEGRSLKKINDLEQKLDEKETVIETLVQNGQQKADEIAELRAKIESIENSRESLMLLLNKVLELEKKLNEQKTAQTTTV